MIDMADIEKVEDWLIGQALASCPVPSMFGDLCIRLRACGVPVDRAMLAWATLHPLIEAEVAFWINGNSVEHSQFAHTDQETDDWLNSPVRAVLINREPMLRRRLENSNSRHDFPLCQQLADDGYSDYLVLATACKMPAMEELSDYTGFIASWATRDIGGFTDDQLSAIAYIQKRLALAARANVESQITRTIAETYLGKWAGNKVLNGQIKHGDGETIRAVIFYTDMRRSTAIAEDLGQERYLAWLNDFFKATAGAILDHGGEILDFIGDAVLGVFPIEDSGFEDSARRAIAAADEMRARIAALNASPSRSHELKAGIALSVGEVMFGNIGVPDRLTFSVIGQTVHAAARIEALTKSLGTDTLMTADIAGQVTHRATLVGDFELTGFGSKRPLYGLSLRNQDPAA